MPNQMSEESVRISYIEDREIDEILTKLATERRIPKAFLIREATSRFVTSAEKSGVTFEPRTKPKRQAKKSRPTK